tara:strand:- start:369 stop:1019 length:651 start_codon:yes stop_codon:yes gene_type:complete
MNKLILIAILIDISIAQNIGMYENDGKPFSGLYFNYDEEEEADATLENFSMGFSYVLDTNLELFTKYELIESKDKTDATLDFDIDGLSFGGYYHIKENNEIPFNLKFGGIYGEAEASANWLKELSSSISSSASGFGGGIYKKAFQSNNSTIYTFYNILFISNITKTSGYVNSEESSKYRSSSFGIGFRSGNLIFTPSVQNNDGNSSLSLNFGILFP